MELEKLKRVKKNCKTRLTKFRSFLENYISLPQKESISVEEIKLRTQKIEDAWKEFDEAQTSLEITSFTPELEVERNEFEENYYKYIAVAKQIQKEREPQGPVSDNIGQQVDLQSRRIAQLEMELRAQREAEVANLRELASSRSSTNEHNRLHFPLPKLNLPTFSGNYEDWLGFRDAFKAIIHDDETIPTVQKLRYLRAYLKDEAARIIDNLETADRNYRVAWDLLMERYNNERMIIKNHMQAIFELSAVSKESSIDLRNLLDDVLRHIRALTVLGEPTDQWNTPLIYLVVSKLDRETKKEWEKIAIGSEVPTFEKLSSFLRDRCQILETLNCNVPEKSRSTDERLKLINNKNNSNKNISTKTFLNTQFVITCPVCQGNHYIQSCPEFIKMNSSQRAEIPKQKGLCFNCLKRNHLVNECKSRGCTLCNRRHHTMLHANSRKEKTTDDDLSTESSLTIKNCHIHDTSKVLLSTALMEVFDSRGGVHACRILLDSGSQPNIITQDLVDILKIKKRNLNIALEVVNSGKTPCTEWANIRVKSKNSNYVRELDFLILPNVTGNVPANIVDRRKFNIPHYVSLADPTFHLPGRIDALIGAEVFYELLMEGQIKLNRPGVLLQNTRLGWIVTGKIGGTWNQTSVKCHMIRGVIDRCLEKF